MSNHFHTGGAKPKPVFLPTTAAIAAHSEVHFIGEGHFSEKGNKNILHLVLYTYEAESGRPAGNIT